MQIVIKGLSSSLISPEFERLFINALQFDSVTSEGSNLVTFEIFPEVDDDSGAQIFAILKTEIVAALSRRGMKIPKFRRVKKD